jgi:pre-mRNA-splicing factor 18
MPAANAGVAFNISNEETIRRLRAKGQPIRLFGESDKDRRLRLRALELIEEKGHERVGGQNDFRKALEDVESAERLMKDRNANSTADEGKGKKKEDSASGGGEIAVLDMALIKTDPDKLYPIIYYALKRVLKEWGESLAERPGKALFAYPSLRSLTRAIEHVKRTTQGKLAAATQVQSAQYLKPLFKLLRSRVRLPCFRSFVFLEYLNLGKFSPSRTTCCHVLQKSCTICKSVSTSEQMMRISAFLSAMRLGP